LRYIKGDVRLKHLLDINIANNEWSLNKLIEEPSLIRNLSIKYAQEGSLLQKDNTSYWTDKQIDRGMKFVDAATKAVDTYTGVKYVNKPVKEKHNYKYDWKNRRWDHEFSVETTRSPKK
jgi:hypothetical protein